MLTKLDNIKDTQDEIELTKMWIKDLQALIKKHSKSATLAENRRQERINLLQCEYASVEEAHEALGYDYISEDEYYSIVDFYEKKEDMQLDLELVEIHRNYLKKELEKAKRDLRYHEHVLKELKVR